VLNKQHREHKVRLDPDPGEFDCELKEENHLRCTKVKVLTGKLGKQKSSETQTDYFKQKFFSGYKLRRISKQKRDK
jgi:hypothetical protein